MRNSWDVEIFLNKITMKKTILIFLALFISNIINAQIRTVTTAGGTTNYVPKFASPTTIGNSLIYDNGTSVSIGNASPTASTAFELNSTTKAILLTRLTSGQWAALTRIPGMMSYNSSKNLFNIYTNYSGGISEQIVTNLSDGTGSQYTRWATGNQLVDAVIKDSLSNWTVAKGIRLDALKLPVKRF